MLQSATNQRDTRPKVFSSSTTIGDGDKLSNVHAQLSWGRKSLQKKVDWNMDVLVIDLPVSEGIIMEELDELPTSPSETNLTAIKLLNFLFIANHVDKSSMDLLLTSFNISCVVNITNEAEEYSSEIKVCNSMPLERQVLNIAMHHTPIRRFFDHTIEFIGNSFKWYPKQ